MGWLIAFVIICIFVFAFLAAASESKKENARNDTFNKMIKSVPEFNPDTKIVGVKSMYAFCVDNAHQKILYLKPAGKIIIPFSSIISVELTEDSTTLFTKSLTSTIGGSLIGGVLAGDAGGVIGGLSGARKQDKSVSKVQVRLHVRDLSKPVINITCFDSSTMTTEKKSSIKVSSQEGYKYREGLSDARRICDLVAVIIDKINNKQNKANANTILSEGTDSGITSRGSKIDELEKLISLKEKGAITEDEFQKMKNSILSESSIAPSPDVETTEKGIITSDVPEGVQEAINQDDIITAVKLYQDFADCSLQEAVDFVNKHKQK